MTKSSLCLALVLATAAAGCAGKPAAPFDTLKTANLTAYRLQNFEPPAATAAVPGAAAPAIPGLPPEIQGWIQQGAAGLSQLLPPGMLPPGVLPGAAAPAPVDTAPRFHTFRILSQTQVIDPDLKESLGEMLGNKDSFDAESAKCPPNVLYPEMGLSFNGGPGAPNNDVLISFSCNQVVSRSFSWPHAGTGMKDDAKKDLVGAVNKLWPQGA